MPFPIDGNRITGDARLRAGQQALLANKRVDQRRLAGIGTADDGDAHRLGVVIGGHVFGVGIDILADQDLALGDEILVILVGAKGPLMAERLDNGVAQIRQALAMLGRNRNGLAQADFPRLKHAGAGIARLGLVGDEHDGLAGAPDDIGKGLVIGEKAGARIDHEENDVGLANGDLGLLAHAALQAFRRRRLEAGRVDHVEMSDRRALPNARAGRG